MRSYDSYKMRYFRCPCGETDKDLRWGRAEPLKCKACGEEMFETYSDITGKAPAVHGDEIDIMVRHAICNEDGTPRRFTSKAELKRVAYEAGYSIHGDTPNPNPRIVEQRQREAEEKAAREKYR